LFDPKSKFFNEIRARKALAVRGWIIASFGPDRLAKLHRACSERLVVIHPKAGYWFIPPLPDPKEEEREWLQYFERNPDDQTAEDMAQRAPLSLLGGDVQFGLLPYCMLAPPKDPNEIGMGAGSIGLCDVHVNRTFQASRFSMIASINRLATPAQVRTICMYVKFHGEYFDESAAAAWLGYWRDLYDGT
jgi:hypothetical protein